MKPLQYWNPGGFEIASFQFKLTERKNTNLFHNLYEFINTTNKTLI